MNKEHAINEITELQREAGKARIDRIVRTENINKLVGFAAMGTSLMLANGFIGGSLAILSGSIMLYNDYRINALRERQEKINKAI